VYAVIETGGKQYVVEKGATITVEKLEGDAGGEVVLDKVLLIKDDSGAVQLGEPHLPNARVVAEIVEQAKSRKIIVFRKGNPKKNWRRKMGHRQCITVLRVKDITFQ